jgi:CRISPR system Cascade subunit CasA
MTSADTTKEIKLRSHADRFGFDLRTEPWVPVVRPDGTQTQLGLREVLLQAHQIRRIMGETPTMTAALHRLLLALLHRAYKPQDDGAWSELWRATQLPGHDLDKYFGEFRDAFDLFHPQRPFLQCPPVASCGPSTAAKLVSGRSTGNNVTLFDHTVASDTVILEPAEAARWLVTLQAWDPGGMKTPYRKDKSSERAPCNHFGVVLVEGSTLKETLLLNTFRYAPRWEQPRRTRATDQPAWEATHPPGPEPDGRSQEGWTDLLTWPARRVWLSTSVTDSELRVDGVVITPGTRLRDQLHEVELMAAFRRPTIKGKPNPKAPLIPVRLYEDRGVWRHSVEFLLPGNQHRIRPRALDHIAELVEAGVISEDTVYTLRVFGQQLDKNASVIESWAEEQIPAPVALLRATDERIGGIIGHAVDLADQVGAALRGMERQYRAEFRADTSIAFGFAYWPQLPKPFAIFLRDLADAYRAGRSETAVAEKWSTVVARTARKAADQWAYGSPRQGRNLLVAGEHHAAFTGLLYRFQELFSAKIAAYTRPEDPE